MKIVKQDGKYRIAESTPAETELWVGVVWVFASIWFIYGLFQDAESRRMWKCVPGEIVSISECDGYSQKRTSLETRHRITTVSARYQYDVGGEIYEGSVRLGETTNWDWENGSVRTKELKSQRRICVYYNPQWPKQSTTEKPTRISRWWFLLPVFGVLIIIGALFERSKKLKRKGVC